MKAVVYEKLDNDLVTNMKLTGSISLMGCLVIGVIPAPLRTQPAGTAEPHDIKIPVRKAGCYNAYYPASAVLKKVYRTIDSSAPLLQSKGVEFFGNITDEGFTVKERAILKEKPDLSDWADENVITESDYRCKPEGLARAEFATRVRKSRSNIKFITLKMAGVSYPNESEWKVRKKWQIWFLVETQNKKTTPAKLISRATYTFQYEIIGRESITVPAGTFEAFKVAEVGSVKIDVNNTGFKMPMDQSVKSAVKILRWYAKDIGLVKSLQEGQAKVVVELIGVEK